MNQVNKLKGADQFPVDDFVTADVAAGTGGLDASIGFETLRPENVGVAFNDSLFFFTFFINAKVSMADLIALGVAMAIGACGGPQIPLRGGRIDALGPGASGVPEPETDVKTTLADFSGAGFNQEDAIGLTACGHTMGGVHHSTFPQIIPESAIGVNNAGGRIAFDDTVANFDINAIQQYVRGNGNGGGPLVTTTNKTVKSDLRLFSSDGNATLQKLAHSTDQFRSICTTLFTRMIDTVPKGVTLTPLLDPSNVKYSNLSLNVDWSGKMTLSGFLRYIEAAGSASAPISLTITLIDRKQRLSQTSVEATTDHKEHSNGVYGPTFHYPFTMSFAGSSGLSGIKIGAQPFQLQDSLFVVPTLSSISPGLAAYNILDPAHEFTFNITAAVSLMIHLFRHFSVQPLSNAAD
jgi:Peroxidase